MKTNWNYPTAVRVGAGCLQEVPTACRELGITSPLLVTDPGLVTLPMVEQAVAYAKERKQFERVIASFQAVKHMCAEMISELEPARSLVWYAAHSFDAIPDESPLMSCHALAHVSEIGREIASVATQVHGGIGWTDEHNVHFWFKRVGVARSLLGGPGLLRERAAQLQGLSAAS